MIRRAGAPLALLAPALLALIMLAGCGPSADDGAPGAVTAGEARALADAQAMLKEQRLPAAAASAGASPAETR